MNKLLVLCGVIPLLFGCGDPDQLSKAKQDYICENKGGVYEYTPTEIDLFLFTCNSGEKFNANVLWDVALPEKYWIKEKNID